MKKPLWIHYILALLIACIVFVPNASALFDSKYVLPEYSEGYPIIVHKDFLGQEVQKFTLAEHFPQCLTHCQSKQAIQLFFSGALIDEIRFYDVYGNDVEIPYKIQYEKSVESEVKTPIYGQVCEDVLNKNTSKIEKQCHDEIIDYSIEMKSSVILVDYELGKSMPKGTYNVWISARKKVNQNIDYQIKSNGIWNIEMAWWDSDWARKKAYTGIGGNYSIINVTYDSDMQADFDDIRFLDSTESYELDYWRSSYVASSSAYFRVNTTGLSSMYMYYKNAAASTTSNLSEMYGGNLVAFYDFEESASPSINRITEGLANNGTWTGTNTHMGKFGIGRNFDGNDEIKVNDTGEIFDFGGGNFTVIYWLNRTGTSYVLARNAAVFSPFLFDYDPNQIYASGNGVAWNVINGLTGIAFTQYKWEMRSFTASNSGNFSVWKNYTVENSVQMGGSMQDVADNMVIGHMQGGAIYLAGTIDELMIFKGKMLNSAEINSIYNTSFEVGAFGAEEELNLLSTSLISPANNYLTNNVSVAFKCNATDETGVLNLTFVLDNKDNYTFTGGVGQNITAEFDRTLAEGKHNWTCRSSDGTNTDTAAWRNVTMDLTNPAGNITYPMNKSIYKYDAAGLAINFTSSDETLLGVCKYAIDSNTYTTITCGNNLTGQAFAIGNHFIKYNVSDSAGNIFAANTVNFTVYGWIDTSYPAFGLAGNSSLFHIAINVSGDVIVEPVFVWNVSSEYTTGIDSYGGAFSRNYNKTFTIPSIIGLNQLVAFRWDMNLTYNGKTEKFSNTTYYVNVSDWQFGLCNATLIQNSVNFTVKNEETLASLNESRFFGTILYHAGNISANKTQNFDNTTTSLTNFPFCIYPPWGSLTTVFNSEYEKSTYSTRNYITFGNAADNSTDQINLYLINSSADTVLVVKVYDSNLIIQKGLLVRMQRYYPSTNTWLEVESDTTDELGQAIMHVIEEEVEYKFIISNSTSTLKTTNPIKIVCYASPCVIELTLEGTTGQQFTNYEGIPGFSYSLAFNNNTNLFTYIFIDSSGTLSSTWLTVYQLNTTNNALICNTSLSGASGTINCNITDYTGSFVGTAYGQFGSIKHLIDKVSATIDNRWRTFGNEGMIWAILFIITLALVGVWNPAVSVGMMLVGVVVIALLGIIALPWIAIISLIIMGGIIISQLRT